jgi:DNA-binding IscR family transcriptional regulator
LARDADQVTLLQVYEAVDGPMVQARCLFGRSICDGKSCLLGGLIETVNREVRQHLERTTLTQLRNIELCSSDVEVVECKEKS